MVQSAAGRAATEVERSRAAVARARRLAEEARRLTEALEGGRTELQASCSAAREAAAVLRATRRAGGGRVATTVLDDPVKRQLFTSHEWLAVRLARRFSSRGEPLEDLQQVALFALARAAARYDADREVRFATYAGKVVSGELKRHFRDRAWSIKLPRSLHDLYHRTLAANELLTHTLGRPPRTAELAVHLRVSEEDIVEAQAAVTAYRSLSLDAPLPQSVDLHLDIGGAEEGYDRFERADLVRRLLGRLTDEDRELVILYFLENRSQAEVGATLGISQVNVSRRLSRIGARLRALAGTGVSPN